MRRAKQSETEQEMTGDKQARLLPPLAIITLPTVGQDTIFKCCSGPWGIRGPSYYRRLINRYVISDQSLSLGNI